MKKNEWINPELANLSIASTKEDSDLIVTEEHCDEIEALKEPKPERPKKHCRFCRAEIGQYHKRWCPYYVSLGKPGDMPGLDATPSAS